MVSFSGEEGDGGGHVMLAEKPGAKSEEGARGCQSVGAAFTNPPDGGGVVAATEDGGEGRHLR